MRSFTSPAARAAGPLLFAPVTFALLALGFSQSFAENEGDEVYSLPPIVVVADLAETPADQVGSSVTTITREEIERSQKNSVLDLLREVPGLDVVRSGGPGGQTSVFMRGGASEHTLVLVDGVEMNDPSSPNGAYDFAGLSAENIERIEILRGAQSALYGSDAIGGVISFITREATGDQRPSFAAEVGGFNTYRASAGFSSSSARVSYTLNVSRFATKGISATSASGQAPVERDGFGRSAVSGRLRYSLSPQVTARLSLRAFESTAELDKSFASFSSGVREDPNLTADTRQAFLSSSVEYESPDRRWRLTGYATVSRHERETVDLPDNVFGPDASNSFFDGEQVKFRLLARGQVFPSHRIVAGVETERELTSQHLLGPFPA
ncbi:MAG: TonB-dependent receptor, partial [Candidatus Zixiibacteriota bacterium]